MCRSTQSGGHRSGSQRNSTPSRSKRTVIRSTRVHDGRADRAERHTRSSLESSNEVSGSSPHRLRTSTATRRLPMRATRSSSPPATSTLRSAMTAPLLNRNRAATVSPNDPKRLRSSTRSVYTSGVTETGPALASDPVRGFRTGWAARFGSPPSREHPLPGSVR
jgi:hypothetical protein